MFSVTIPPLVVLSLDGFASEYLDRGLVPSLDELAECGTRADVCDLIFVPYKNIFFQYVYPAFPTKVQIYVFPLKRR